MSNKDVVKKRIERFYVEWFLGQAQLPPCKLIDCERPDFALDFGNKKVGLEITKLYKNEGRKGSRNKQIESKRQKLLSGIADKYYASSNVPLSIKIFIMTKELDIIIDREPDERDIIVDNIASELAQRNSAGILELQRFEIGHIKIHMRRLPHDPEKYPEFINYRRWNVVNSHVGWASDLKEEDVLNKINKKILKLTKYEKQFDENILLIVIDSTFASGMFHDIPHAIYPPKNNFSSVYVALYPEKVKEILHI